MIRVHRAAMCVLVASAFLAGCAASGTAFYNPNTQQVVTCGASVGWGVLGAPVAAAQRLGEGSCRQRLRELGFITEDDLVAPAGVTAERASVDRSACLDEAPSVGWPTTFGLGDYEWSLRRHTEAAIRCLLAHGWSARERQ